MSKTKTKGNRLENLVVDKCHEFALQAERVPLSGSLGGKYSDDVVIGSIDNPLYRVECKNRESISKNLWLWSKDVDILVVKRNYEKPLAVVDLEFLLKLLSN